MSTPMARIADMTEASFNRTVGNEFPLGANVLRLPTNRYESPKIATQATVKLEHARARFDAGTSDSHEIIGNSPALKAVLELVEKVAKFDSTVLLLGETGTGKELIAHAIHQGSPRRDRAFVKVNCAALPAELIASELFGHEKGAFTSAMQQRIGRFESANGGTIFLDEIAELSPEMQVALLRVLQEKEFERVGGNRTIKTDVR